mmetsp:Transcript_2667/g.2314  ORF Transcript_2667/g.2314 Transcript_2667/m.2314 type:complete len:179 (-) Transcript_2667:728-1264(-)
MEYLHSKTVYHLDLKLENLLLGEDLQLKICDFDICYFEGDEEITAKGTPHYRAPEIKHQTCSDPAAADVYSLAIIMFSLRTGVLPYYEDEVIRGLNLQNALHTDPELFWKFHETHLNEKIEDDFKELFIGMTQKNPMKRMTLKKVIESEWVNGPCYSDKNTQMIIKQKIKCAEMGMLE